MSRIHEALRKAQLERAGVTGAADLTPLAVESQPPAATSDGGHGAATAVLVQPEAGTARAKGPYRFQEIEAGCAHPRWEADPKVSVFNPQIGTHGAEQFRTLRSRLYQARGQQPGLKILLITSAIPGEGKTFVTSNLAEAIVRQHDRRALVIDSDLRCSRLHAPLGAPHAPGLSDYLRGDADELAVIQQGPQGNLCLIAGGGAVTNPSELLSNGRLKTLLDRVAPAFDWVLIDSPPCVPVADATVVADMCDGILLVVRAASTPAAVVEKARQELQARNVVGVVLNAADKEAVGYSSYYGSSYYGHGATQGLNL